MKKFLKIFGVIVLVLLLMVGASAIYFVSSFPKVGPARNLTIASTPERVARGKYLANHVAACFSCHSTRNFDYYAGPIVPGTGGKGGQELKGDFGTIHLPNITPAALGSWSDGELVRAITAGVNNEGKALFPMMPYREYGQMDEEDLKAIVAYLRALPPIPNGVPKSKLKFPINLIVRTIPQSANLQPRPDVSDTLAYGKYLVTMAACGMCHTQTEKGKPIPGMEFAGGVEFPLPGGHTVRSANITPESVTGIDAWDKAYFIGRFKEYANPTVAEIPVEQGGDNTVMPWTMYAGMTEKDIGAIYSYLRTLKPVRNEVEKHP